MARTLFSAILCLCLLGSSTVTAAETAPDFQTTTPAVFLPRPAPPAWWSRSGEAWIAVFGGGASRKFELKTVQSKIYVDSRDAVIKLGAQNSPDPLFFLSGMKLKTGTIETAEGIKLGVALSLSDSSSIDFNFNKETWKLKRKTLAKKPGAIDYNEADVSYHLTNGKKEIELGQGQCRLSIRFSHTSCEEKLAVNFIGDLDRDKVPDLFLTEAPDRQGAEAGRLYLSSLKSSVPVANEKDLREQSKPFQSQSRKSGKDEGLQTKTPGLLVTGRTIESRKGLNTFDSWYAYFTEQKKLEPTKLWVACQPNQCDESLRIQTSQLGKNGGEPLFLVRGVAGLKPGVVREATVNPEPMDPDRDLGFPSFDIEFGGSKRKLIGGVGLYTLETAEKKTVFPLKTLDPDDKPKLLWAGDLNFDGQVDLYFEVPQDGGLNHVLYISPEAATGPITGPTARVCSGSCN